MTNKHVGNSARNALETAQNVQRHVADRAIPLVIFRIQEIARGGGLSTTFTARDVVDAPEHIAINKVMELIANDVRDMGYNVGFIDPYSLHIDWVPNNVD